MLRGILLIFGFTWSFSHLFGQVDLPRIDSLNNAIHVADSDSLKLRLVRDLAFEYFRKDEAKYKQVLEQGKKIIETSTEPLRDRDYLGIYTSLSHYALRYGQLDSALYFAKAAEERAKSIDDPNELEVLWSLKARIASRKGDVEEQLRYEQKGLDFTISTGNQRSISIAKLNIAQPLRKLRRYAEALEALQGALAAAKAVDFELIQGTIHSNIAIIYDYLGFEEKFLAHTFKSLAIHQKHGYDQRLIDNYSDLTVYYKGDQDSIHLAEKYALLGLEALERTPIPFQHLSTLANLIDINIRLDRSESIEQYQTQLNALIEELPEDYLAAYIGTRIEAQIAAYKGQNAKAIELFEQLLQNDYFVQNNETDDVHRELGRLYASRNNADKVLYHLSIADALRDSTTLASNIERVAFLEAENTNIENEKSIALLEKENAIAEAKTRQTTTAALGVGALALLGFGFFWNARRKNKQIAAQNHEITEKNSLLEQLNQTKDRLFAIIGHDLRKPVVAFNGISETINYLIKKEDYRTLQQLGSEIEQDGFALQKLTDNLLNWAILQRDVMPHNPSSVNLNQCVAEVISIFRKVSEKKGILLQNETPESLSAQVDITALTTILINLVDNAIKYTPEGGTVSVTAINSDSGIQLKVIDTGIGMFPPQLENAFSLQKDKTTKGTAGESGTGLGLHLVQELVSQNQGKIAVESTPEIGSTFTLTFPEARRTA